MQYGSPSSPAHAASAVSVKLLTAFRLLRSSKYPFEIQARLTSNGRETPDDDAWDAEPDPAEYAKIADTLYHFAWDEVCDWYIEVAKPHLYMSDELVQDPARNAKRHVVQGVLATTLETTMRLLHPFAPYVTFASSAEYFARWSRLSP